jgi:hypothetical protein
MARFFGGRSDEVLGIAALAMALDHVLAAHSKKI